MNLHAPQKQLNDATTALQNRWRALADTWRDPAARRFHEDHVAPIAPAARNATQAMARLADTIARAERECS